MQRSPLRSSSPKEKQQPIQHYDSEPNLNTSSITCLPNITQRSKKRLRTDNMGISGLTEHETLKSMMSSQDEKLETMMSFMRDMKQQMSEVQKSVDFMSSKYDELLAQFSALHDEHQADRKRISLLEQKIEYMERNNKTTTIEIKNIPMKKAENNIDLYRVVEKTASILNIPLQQNDVKNVYRVNTSNPSNKPIVTEFTTIFKKDEIVNAVKQFNKKNHGDMLSTKHLLLDGPEKPVYVSDCLTFKTKKLYAMARQFAKTNNWKYCWISRGSVYLRKADGLPSSRIGEESDFNNLPK